MMFFKIHQLYKHYIRKFIYILIILIFHIIFIYLDAVAGNQGEFISINDIHPGMKGIGKTVFSGIRIEEFEVEVIDIIRGTEVNYPYILVKLSGDRIDNNGGISAGMSGSPVYFEDKLAGAISHSWEMSEHNLCLITPIDAMLTLFNYTAKESQNAYCDNLINDSIISISLDENLKRKLTDIVPLLYESNNISANNRNSTINFQYIQSPLLINGFKGRAQDYVKNMFQKYGVTYIHNISEYQESKNGLEINTGNKKIIPGSAIGVQLSTGDVSIIGIGTATYSRYNYVLALGHPFLHHGAVSYLLTSVYIHHSFPSIVMPFKIGSPYLLLGEVIQDRSAGILAKLNKFPNIVSCKIKVSDLDHDINMTAGTKVVPQKEIAQSIVPALLIQSVDNAIDRIGQGTGVIKFDFRNADTGEVLSYDNIFFSENDIAVEISNDLNNLFDLLYYNFYEKIDLNEIIMDVTIKELNQKAIIKEVKLNTKEYQPGDNVEIQLTITPFRQPAEQKIVQIKLPDDITSGDAVLVVRGCSSKEKIEEQPITEVNQHYFLNGWEEIKKYLMEKEKNNQIIAEVILFNENESLESTSKIEVENSKSNLKVILDTDFVMDGYHEIFLNIKNKKVNKPE